MLNYDTFSLLISVFEISRYKNGHVLCKIVRVPHVYDREHVIAVSVYLTVTQISITVVIVSIAQCMLIDKHVTLGCVYNSWYKMPDKLTAPMT